MTKEEQEFKDMWGEVPIITRLCLVCGEEFTSTKSYEAHERTDRHKLATKKRDDLWNELVS